jgi:protein-tyrosine-phosphatase
LEFAEIAGDANIDDPVNLDREQYNQLMKQVEKGVVKSIEKIIEINKK